jgi:DNA-binding response OmpR family regulator
MPAYFAAYQARVAAAPSVGPGYDLFVTQPPLRPELGPPRALLIDPEPGFRRVLRDQLEQDAAWQVDEVATIEAAQALGMVGTDRRAADLVVVTAIGRTARTAIARWRRDGLAAPVVALVAPSGRAVAGASLTIRKPVRLTDLLAAIAALHAHGGPGAAVAVNGGPHGVPVPAMVPGRPAGGARQIGPYSFEPAAKRLVERARARTIRLTEKEAAMLDLLWQAAGTVVPRDALLARVWGYQAGLSTHTLETHVYRLRRKIERDPAHAELLITELGGYRLVR